MGCATSKLDDHPAVTLCRLRFSNLNLALHHRLSLSHSHLSYFHSLSSLSLSLSLRHFFNSSSLPPLAPSPSPSPPHSPSPSSSHLHFNSDSDDNITNTTTTATTNNSNVGLGFGFEENNHHGYININYMNRHPTPSLSYHQRPPTSETIHFGVADPSSSTTTFPSNHYGGPAPRVAQPPPPPPPVASTSAWDFLNFFEAMEGSYPSYTPSMDSREVREKEGIPDLEDDSFDHRDHHLKRAHPFHPHHKFVVPSITGADTDHDVDSKGGSKRRKNEDVGPSSAAEKEEKPVEYEVHMVDEKVVVGEESKAKKPKPGFGSLFEVVREIQIQFERASASGHELYKVLEVGKFQYQPKNVAFQVSSRMLNSITPSLPSSKEPEATLDPDEDLQLRSVNLTVSLQKLLLWEKKLFKEVKAEEKMRVEHDKKLQKLKRMGERGAEAHKIESTRSMVRDLSTRIKMAIQVVDNISVKINKVRDEELWPQLNELIQGLSRMWKAMLECHHNQCQAIVEARGLDAIAFPKNPSDSQLEASLQLEHDLINWTYRFTEWVGAQKGFVRTLNGWLVKCLYLEPEETVDGVAPFSPGRAGAPPVFVICNMWDLSLERICETSGKEVVDSMRDFASTIWHFRERDKGELRQRMTANRDIERKVKNLERQDSKLQKEMQALDKKLLLTSGGSDGLLSSGHVVYQSDTSSKISLQAGLLRIFEAMDGFAADSVKVYKELLQRSEELAQEHMRAS